MRKLYFLDEQEKNRILNLHESRTKQQYLIEKNEIKEYIIPAVVGGLTLLGTALVNGVMGMRTAQRKEDTIEVLNNFCKSNTLQPTLDSAEINNIIEDIRDSLKAWNFLTLGYSSNKDVEKYTRIFNNLPSIADYCELDKTFREKYQKGDEKQSLLRTLSSEIVDDEGTIWKEKIHTPLLNLMNRTQVELSKTEEPEIERKEGDYNQVANTISKNKNCCEYENKKEINYFLKMVQAGLNKEMDGKLNQEIINWLVLSIIKQQPGMVTNYGVNDLQKVLTDEYKMNLTKTNKLDIPTRNAWLKVAKQNKIFDENFKSNFKNNLNFDWIF